MKLSCKLSCNSCSRWTLSDNFSCRRARDDEYNTPSEGRSVDISDGEEYEEETGDEEDETLRDEEGDGEVDEDIEDDMGEDER